MKRSLINKALLRDHIGNSLRLYFERDIIIQSNQQNSLAFTEFWGERDYRQAVAELYIKKPQGWITPSEVFAPHYSHAIARWIQASHSKRFGGSSEQRSIRIVEIGGGTGTNAAHICEWFRKAHPESYAKLNYTLLDISHKQSARQANIDIINPAYLTEVFCIPNRSLLQT